MARNKNWHMADYQTSVSIFAFYCTLFTGISQLAFIGYFNNPPSPTALWSLVAYMTGSFTAVAYYEIRNRGNNSFRNCEYDISQSFFSRLTLCLAIILIPDILISLDAIMNSPNPRVFLTSESRIYFLDPRIITVITNILLVVAYYQSAFIKQKTKGTYITIVLSVLIKSVIYASRGELILLAIFIFLGNSKKIALKNILYIVIVYALLLFISIMVQKRIGSNTFTGMMQGALFYGSYFGYPLYLADYTTEVFGDFPLLYSVLGYPADVVHTLLSERSGFTTYLEFFSTRVIIGSDILGNYHNAANVLFPQYSFLYEKVGYFGIFLFYFLCVYFACVAENKSRKMKFALRIFIFIILVLSGRTHALGVMGTWVILLSSILLSIYLDNKMTKTGKKNLLRYD